MWTRIFFYAYLVGTGPLDVTVNHVAMHSYGVLGRRYEDPVGLVP
jgi:hypothetical protein